MWWHMSVMAALKRLKLEDREVKVTVDHAARYFSKHQATNGVSQHSPGVSHIACDLL
jgi:hypothetical protein